MSKKISDQALADGGRETEPHITVLYGISGPPSIVAKLRRVTHGWSIHAKLGATSIFEVPDKGFDVVKIEVKSFTLQELRRMVEGVAWFESDFPDYQPHVTLAYVKPGCGALYAGMKDVDGASLEFTGMSYRDADGKREEITF